MKRFESLLDMNTDHDLYKIHFQNTLMTHVAKISKGGDDVRWENWTFLAGIHNGGGLIVWCKTEWQNFQRCIISE